MPYILYSLEATAQDYCQRQLSTWGIWARARVAAAHYARIPAANELRAAKPCASAHVGLRAPWRGATLAKMPKIAFHSQSSIYKKYFEEL